MAHESRADLDSLRVIVSQLNEALSEASGVVQDVDRYLAEEFDIGVWAISRPFGSQHGTGEGGRELLISSHLAYGKAAGRNRLHILAATLERGEGSDQFTQIVSEERIPWPLCPRETKLHSFAMLPELLGTLALKAEEITAQTSRTSETVRQLLKTMGRHSHGSAEPALVTNGVGADPDAGLFRRSRSR
ncbi:hypothetical protein V5E97_38205 [Singulisphaera sp. Ch08]|uniref:Uncharacterized protein n=1 Tax=Singulisphaera sp. Ch08 TaxID=3120278 RepID=A0AAU7CGA5_9BACT